MSEIKLSGDLKSWSDTKRKSKGFIISEVERSMLAAPPDPRDARTVHASEVSQPDWCERATYNRITTGDWPKENFNLIRENIFAEGDFIHEKWQRWMVQTGKLWGLWECRMCGTQGTELSGELPPYCSSCQCAGDEEGNPLDWWTYKEVPLKYGILTGHEDGAIDNYLVEIKSVGVGSLRKEDLKADPACCAWKTWQGLKRPLIQHQIQGQLYLYMAMKMELPFDRLAVIYEFKPNQQVKEFDLSWNPKLVEPYLKRIGSIERALDVKMGLGEAPPDCPYGGCKYCEPKGEKKSAEVRAPRGRTAKSTTRANRIAREAGNHPDGGTGSVGELHSGGTSGSGSARKVRRRHD